MHQAHILIVDDEPHTRRLIAIHMREAGMQYTEAASGREALSFLEEDFFDLVILDLMMDDTDGLQVLKELHARQMHTPLIVLSAITEIEKKIETLGLGADDYVTKPFIPSELTARVIANIRRSRHPFSSTSMHCIQYGPIRLNKRSLTVEIHGVAHALSQTECDLLSVFLQQPGHTFTKEEIYEAVWKHDHFDANNLSVYINYLRKKIEDDPKSPQYIQTIWGIGYRLLEV
ncbi:response regulator transcription factor [Marinicrinis sediminis]|uniref:Response regulator transcription factor n=1 Tax=Marinicrinis sediminis TaxID=1652465 RepID=A0ABW5R8Y8_9BACL